MTLNQLVYFVQIAKFENYRTAADILHVSQPSLSRSMAALEEELGIALFEKKGRGVKLTKAGHFFLEHARSILSECKAANKTMEVLASGGGIVELGYVFPLAGRYVPSQVRSFLDQPGNEGVTFHFWQNHTPAIVEKIKKGQLDVGFGGCVDQTDLEYCPLFSQEMVLVTPKDHPLAGKEELSLEECCAYPFIGYDRQSWMGIHTLNLYEEFGVEPHITAECPDEYTILSLVRENFGIALVPRTDILDDMDNVVVHSIKDKNLAHRIFMFWKKDQEQLPAVERFIAFMKEQARATDSLDESKVYLKDIIHYRPSAL